MTLNNIDSSFVLFLMMDFYIILEDGFLIMIIGTNKHTTEKH